MNITLRSMWFRLGFPNRLGAVLCFLVVCLCGGPALAQSSSYINSSDTYNWIDASTHNRLRAYSATYPYPENSSAATVTVANFTNGSATVTISIANPGVVTWNAHGLAAGTRLVLSTTGTLPTGLTAGATYFVVNPSTNTFQLSATSGGTAIATSGSQSGTHTARVNGIVSWPAHGLASGTVVVMGTTGALPTNLTAGNVYYVVNPSADSFQLATTVGGTPVVTSGTQSGTHTAKAISSTISFPRTGPPYFLYTPAGSQCGTGGTTIDDRLSDPINIGFTFKYGGVDFTQVRVMSNGRIQFNNNVTCGAGTDSSGATIYTYDYPDTAMNYTMRIYGADLDSTPKSFRDGTFTAPVNPSYNTNCLDDAQCYISVATIGTAPSRKFVVTWNNVPKWTTGNVIAGNFNLQIILEEGGDFVYQFGNVADSQANVPAQIGWQVNTNDYDIKQTALPTNNSAIRYTLPKPLIQYEMEQSSWTGTAGQVIDTSGNGNHGSRLGPAQVTTGGYSCNGADIPSNTSTGANFGIDTGFNMSSQLAGAGAITFWYKPNAWTGASAAVANAQLLDASTTANGWFYLSKIWVSATTSKLRFAVRDGTNTTRFVETAAMSNSVLSGSGWIHIGVTWNFNTLTGTNQDRLRIYINGSPIASGNSVQSLFTTSGAPINTIGTLYIGDNRSSNLDGTNGTGNSANGVIDEFRLYNLEVGYSQILTDYSRPAACTLHYAISHAGSTTPPGNGTTCLANAVTIAAHDGSDQQVPTSTTISISTSTGLGDWTKVSGAGTLTPGPANSGTATYKFLNESQVYLSLSHTTSGTVNINVTDGTRTEKSGAEDADLSVLFCTNPGFNGCEYSNASRCSVGTTGYDQLYTKLAGRQFKLDAVALTPASPPALQTAFSGTVQIDLLANLSPTAVTAGTNCPTSQTAVIPLGSASFSGGRLSGPLTVAAGALAGVSPGYSAYRDVRMRFTCDATNCPPSGVQVCSRDAFAVRPTDLLISSATNNTSATAGTPRVAAGTAFNMSAQARTANSLNAQGYNGTPRITATTAAQSVSAQATGTSATPTLSDYTDRLKDANVNNTALFGSASATTGTANTQLYYLDYGGFWILAGGLQDPDFVNATIDPPGTDCVAGSSTNTDQDPDADREKFGCVVANQANAGLFGRFYPSSFVLNSSAITAGCAAGGYTYEGQPFGINFNVSALSSGSVIAAQVMPRYNAGTVVIGAENNNDGVNLSSRVALNVTPVWANGAYVAAAPAATFSRLTTPDGAFDLLDIGIQVTDPDGATLGNARNMRPTDATACTTATCTHQKLAGSPVKMRFGRIRLANALGSERLALSIPIEAQYWNGALGFTLNNLDTCTSLGLNNFSLVNQVSPVTSANVTVSSVAAMVAGRSVVVLSKTTPLPSPWSNTGSVDLILNLGATGATVTCPTATPASPLGSSVSANAGYLAGNTCGAAAYDRNPTARATFGVYKSPLIYRRENY